MFSKVVITYVISLCSVYCFHVNSHAERDDSDNDIDKETSNMFTDEKNEEGNSNNNYVDLTNMWSESAQDHIYKATEYSDLFLGDDNYVTIKNIPIEKFTDNTGFNRIPVKDKTALTKHSDPERFINEELKATSKLYRRSEKHKLGKKSRKSHTKHDLYRPSHGRMNKIVEDINFDEPHPIKLVSSNNAIVPNDKPKKLNNIIASVGPIAMWGKHGSIKKQGSKIMGSNGPLDMWKQEYVEGNSLGRRSGETIRHRYHDLKSAEEIRNNHSLISVGPLGMWSTKTGKAAKAKERHNLVDSAAPFDFWGEKTRKHNTDEGWRILRSESQLGHNFYEGAHSFEDRQVSEQLKNSVKVLCLVMTYPENYDMARHIKATWGKRCNRLLFMSTAPDSAIPVVELGVPESKDNLWGKTKAAFSYVFQNHMNEVDWFIKTDDDTYVVMENLRYMLSGYDTEQPLYFGCRFKQTTGPQGYMNSGAGYVLSKTALKKLVTVGLKNPRICKAENSGVEDVEMGLCLEHLGVKAIDTRDSQNRGRFFPLDPGDTLRPTKDKKFWNLYYQYYPPLEGMNCCSDYAISFHYVPPRDMYVLEYLIYHLRPYGIKINHEDLPRMLRDSREHPHFTKSAQKNGTFEFLNLDRFMQIEANYSDSKKYIKEHGTEVEQKTNLKHPDIYSTYTHSSWKEANSATKKLDKEITPNPNNDIQSMDSQISKLVQKKDSELHKSDLSIEDTKYKVITDIVSNEVLSYRKNEIDRKKSETPFVNTKYNVITDIDSNDLVTEKDIENNTTQGSKKHRNAETKGIATSERNYVNDILAVIGNVHHMNNMVTNPIQSKKLMKLADFVISNSSTEVLLGGNEPFAISNSMVDDVVEEPIVNIKISFSEESKGKSSERKGTFVERESTRPPITEKNDTPEKININLQPNTTNGQTRFFAVNETHKLEVTTIFKTTITPIKPPKTNVKDVVSDVKANRVKHVNSNSLKVKTLVPTPLNTSIIPHERPLTNLHLKVRKKNVKAKAKVTNEVQTTKVNTYAVKPKATNHTTSKPVNNSNIKRAQLISKLKGNDLRKGGKKSNSVDILCMEHIDNNNV